MKSRAASFARLDIKADLVVLAAALLLTAITFGNAIDGEFVYDDTRQIVANPLVIESGRIGEALSSDVWAFKRGDEAVSNYWRPTFVLWLIANQRLFGLADTTPWHLSNILLHFGVLCMAYGLLRQLDVARPLSAAIVFLFAVHPAHVESVTWISGSPDVLLSVAVLGALWLVLSQQERPAAFKIPLALLAHIVAVGSKELGIMLPVLVFVAVATVPEYPDRQLKSRLVRAGRVALPFLVVSVVYFLVRLAILGRVEVRTDWHHGALDLILTAPSLLAFYLRQAILPYSLGPNYALRAVTPDNVTLINFWLPVVLSGLFGWVVWRALRRGAVAWIGATLFALFLLPAMNINAFLPEQLVHDRYLYLPLFGLLMIVIPEVAALVGRFGGVDRQKAATAVLVGATIVSLPLVIQSRRYNKPWMSDLALWSWGVRTDPTSAFNWTMYGVALSTADRLDEAREALDRAIAIDAVTDAYLGRAAVSGRQGRIEEAVSDLQKVIASYPDDHRAYEQLAVAYQQAGDLRRAATALRTGREHAPYHRCAFTSNLGVVLYASGDKAASLEELAQVPQLAPGEFNAACRHGLFHLGLVQAELGRRDAAREAFTAFLDLTAPFADERTLKFRDMARTGLARLDGP